MAQVERGRRSAVVANRGGRAQPVRSCCSTACKCLTVALPLRIAGSAAGIGGLLRPGRATSVGVGTGPARPGPEVARNAVCLGWQSRKAPSGRTYAAFRATRGGAGIARVSAVREGGARRDQACSVGRATVGWAGGQLQRVLGLRPRRLWVPRP